jgi:hypothetical protein
MKSPRNRKENDGPAFPEEIEFPEDFDSPEEAVEEKPPPPKHRPVNKFAFASLLIGSGALIWASFPIWASLPFLKIVSVILGIAGLFAGIGGLNAHPCFLKEKIWSYAGISGSLLAVIFGGIAVVQGWVAKHSEVQLTQVPLRIPRTIAQSQGSADVEKGWVDAGKNAVQQGDVRVRLVSISFGPVPFKKPPEEAGQRKSPPTKSKKPPEKYLVVHLRISNAGAGQLIQYTGWSHPSSDAKNQLTLQDDAGKNYPLKVFPADREITGQVDRAAIPPTKWVDEVLVFDGNPGQVRYLHLELPGSAVGAKDPFRLQIPGRMIVLQ